MPSSSATSETEIESLSSAENEELQSEESVSSESAESTELEPEAFVHASVVRELTADQWGAKSKLSALNLERIQASMHEDAKWIGRVVDEERDTVNGLLIHVAKAALARDEEYVSDETDCYVAAAEWCLSKHEKGFKKGEREKFLDAVNIYASR